MKNSGALVITLVLFASAGRGRAAAFIWDGGGSTGGVLNWTTASNWDSNVIPDNNGTADITFAGTIDPNPNLNLAWSINSLTFASGAGAFTLGSGQGAVLTIGSGGIVDLDDSLQTITHGIVLGGAQGWRTSAGGMLTVTGAINNGGHLLSLAAGGGITLGGSISGGGGLRKTGTGTLLFNGSAANSATGLIEVLGGTLRLEKAENTAAIASPLQIGNATGAIIGRVENASDHQIADSAAVSVLAAGAWDLAGHGERMGSLSTVSTGVAGGGEITIGAGQLSVASLSMTAGSISSTGTGALGLGGPLSTLASNLPASISGSVQLGSASRDFTIADGAAAIDLDLPAAVTAGTLRKLGPGTLRLSGANFAAGLTAAGGRVAVTSAAAAGTGLITLSGGELYGENAAPALANPVTIAGAATLGNVQIDGPVTLQGDAAVTSSGASNTQVKLNGPVSGAASLTLDAPGGQIHFGSAQPNTYTGVTTVRRGIVRVINAGAVAIPGNVVAGEDVADLHGQLLVHSPETVSDTATVTVRKFGMFYGISETIGTLQVGGGHVSGNVRVNGGVVFSGGSFESEGASSLRLGTAGIAANGATTTSINAPVNLDGRMQTFSITDGAAATDASFSQSISNGGIEKTGSGLLQLSGNNSFAGGLRIQAGAVEFTGHENAAGAGTITMNGGVIQTPPDGFTLKNPLVIGGAAAITGPDTALLMESTVQINAGATLTVNHDGHVLFLREGAHDPDVISGAGRIVKTGTGILYFTLPGGTSYAGGTHVSEGALYATNTSGSATGSGPVVMSGQSVLVATGAIAGPLVMSGNATLYPGGGLAGTLATGPLTLGPGNTVRFDLSGGNGSDLLVVNGALTLDGTLVVVAPSGLADGTYRLCDYTGSLTNNGIELLAEQIARIDLSTPGQVNLIVGTSTNRPPQAGNDAASTPQGTSLSIPVSFLLSNDTDPDGDTLTVQGVVSVSTQGGAVTLNGDTIIYSPPAGFSDNDSFSYILSDGRGGTASGTVQVTVTATSAPHADFLGMTYEAGGTRLRWRGLSGRTYRLEHSNALTGWQILSATVTANGAGIIEILDPTLPLPKRRFYRLITLQ